jgi:hypothetical protein
MKCGKRVGDDYIDPELEQRLYERIENRLAEKWISKDAVEKEVALNAATKLNKWARLLGIPAAFAVAILAFVGIKSSTDLASIEAQTAAVKKTASDLAAQYKPLEDELPRLTQIASSVRGLEDRLKTVESAVARFAPSSALKESTQTELLTALAEYTAYLKKLGLAPKSVPSIYVQEKLPEPGYDAYAEDDKIYVKPDHANRAKVLHEFSHGALLGDVPEPADRHWSYSALEAGLEGVMYFSADILQ